MTTNIQRLEHPRLPRSGASPRLASWTWLARVAFVIIGTAAVLILRAAQAYVALLMRRAAPRAASLGGALFLKAMVLIAGTAAAGLLAALLWGAAWLTGLVP